MNIQQKNYWLQTMREHQAAGRLVQGAWLRDQDETGTFRGCFFGCAMQTTNSPLEKAAVAMGVPEVLIHLAEKIFENLPSEQAVEFPVQFIEAINPDADLSRVHHVLEIKRMERLIELHKELGDEYGLLKVLKLIIEYHQDPTEEKREVALSTSRSVYSTSRSVDSAALSAVWSVESTADSAAWSAALSARSAALSARSAAWKQEKEVLLSVLKETKYDPSIPLYK